MTPRSKPSIWFSGETWQDLFEESTLGKAEVDDADHVPCRLVHTTESSELSSLEAYPRLSRTIHCNLESP